MHQVVIGRDGGDVTVWAGLMSAVGVVGLVRILRVHGTNRIGTSVSLQLSAVAVGVSLEMAFALPQTGSHHLEYGPPHDGDEHRRRSAKVQEAECRSNLGRCYDQHSGRYGGS